VALDFFEGIVEPSQQGSPMTAIADVDHKPSRKETQNLSQGREDGGPANKEGSIRMAFYDVSVALKNFCPRPHVVVIAVGPLAEERCGIIADDVSTALPKQI
jgi:hypothetical protein